MARVLILDTRTRWHVTLPENLEEEPLIYAWQTVLKLASRISSAKGGNVSVQLTVPFPLRERLLTEPEKEAEKTKKTA